MVKILQKIIATGLGSGLAPAAPGTFGTAAGVLLLWLLSKIFPEIFDVSWIQWSLLTGLIIITTLAGVWSADALEKEWGKDSQRIVIDEIAGVWVAMLGLPVTFLNLGFAFLFFRIFDIWKPLGIRKMESLYGGWGVMMDDILAGIYACIACHLLLLILY
jgi:phosphatidylglycerophosphatase A